MSGGVVEIKEAEGVAGAAVSGGAVEIEEAEGVTEAECMG